jgi:hypothetical protein
LEFAVLATKTKKALLAAVLYLQSDVQELEQRHKPVHFWHECFSQLITVYSASAVRR